MKKNIILLPGAGCSKNFYKDIIPNFEKKFNIDVLSYEGNTLEEMTSNLLLKLNAIDYEFILVAHCFSGLFSIKAIAENTIPNLTGLVLCNSPSNFTILPKEFLSEENGEHTKDYVDFPIVIKAKKYLLSDELIDKHLNIALSTNVDKYLKCIKLPTLILCSDKDGYFDVELFKSSHKNIANSKFVVIEGARHLGLLTHADKYIDSIYQWSNNI